jgi:hypothetical protein
MALTDQLAAAHDVREPVELMMELAGRDEMSVDRRAVRGIRLL